MAAPRGVREDAEAGRFGRLDSPSFEGSLTISRVAAGPDPAACAERAREYVEGVCSVWEAEHARTISDWYDAFVLADDF